MYKYFTPIFSGLAGDGLCGFEYIEIHENEIIFRVDFGDFPNDAMPENSLVYLSNKWANELQFVEWETPVIVETERPSDNRQWFPTGYAEIESDIRL